MNLHNLFDITFPMCERKLKMSGLLQIKNVSNLLLKELLLYFYALP